MGKLNDRWYEKMAEIGWRPPDINELTQKYLGEYPVESIMGVIHTGDAVGNLIGVSTSHVRESKRIEKTIVGFTVGGDNSIVERSVILPEDRIPGCLFITSHIFIACGFEKTEFPYSGIIVASSMGRTTAAANYDLQKLGIRNYSYSEDIFISKFEINRQDNLNCGYDDLTIVFVIKGKASTGNGIHSIPEVWHQMERKIITKEE
jgi:hypothetical protein